MSLLFFVSFAWIERDIRYYRPKLDLKYQLARKLSFSLLWHISENGEQNISKNDPIKCLHGKSLSGS